MMQSPCVQEDLPELYEDGNARWVLLHLLRADNARQLPPAAREVLQPPAKARLVGDTAAVSPAADDDGNDEPLNGAQVLVSCRPRWPCASMLHGCTMDRLACLKSDWVTAASCMTMSLPPVSITE